MSDIFILPLLGFQVNITEEFSYKDINIKQFEDDVSSIVEDHPDATILICEMIERRCFASSEQNTIDRVFEVLERVAPKYFLVVDGTLNHEVTFGGRVAYLPGCMMLPYYHIWMKGHPIASEWNPTTSKGLMLLGKCKKIHRIGLLKKFYEAGELDSIEWTAHFVKERNIIKERFFADYTEEEFDTFSNICNRTVDLPDDHPCHPSTETQNFHHQGFPFDHTLYERTAFSVILESEYYTNCGNNPNLSEKIWRAIANKHPFIMVGGESNIPELKKLGFKTFEEYLAIIEYYSLFSTTKDVNVALDSIVTNTVEFYKLLANPSSDLVNQIKADVDHNYNLFESMMNKYVADFIHKTNLDEYDVGQLISYHLSPWCQA